MSQQSCIWTLSEFALIMVPSILLEPMHIYLSGLDSNRKESDVFESFKIISWSKNQQIGVYWFCRRRDKIRCWKDIFEDLNDLGFFDLSDEVILECMRFCFIALIRKDLSSIKFDWNVHINLSHCYNSENCLAEVGNKEISAPYATLESPQEDYSECFDDFGNLALDNQ